MVLHNNKWDRKAKRAHLRKLNIEAPVEEAQRQKWSAKHAESDSSPGSSDAEDVETGDASPQKASEPEENAQGTQWAVHEELPSLENNAEEDELIAQHIAKIKQEPKFSKPNIQYSSDQAEFDRINEAIEQGKLSQDIRRRFGGSTAKKLDLEEDDDEFWEHTKLSGPSQQWRSGDAKVETQVGSEKEAWLDEILG